MAAVQIAHTRRACDGAGQTHVSLVVLFGVIAAWAYDLLLTAHLLTG